MLVFFRISLLAFFLAPCFAQGQSFDLAMNKNWAEARLEASSDDATMKSLVEWLYVSDKTSGASFYEIATFLNNHKNWPEPEKAELNAEFAMLSSSETPSFIIKWFDNKKPRSGVGKMALAEAYIANGAKLESVSLLIKEAWIEGDFSPEEEVRIYTKYSNILGKKEHEKRINRLLWEEKITPAERCFFLVPQENIRVFKAWIALIKGEKNAPILVESLSEAEQAQPGILFSRIVWRDKRDDEEGVIQLLLKAPKEVPYAKNWWKYRARAVREAVFQKNYSLASNLLKSHGQTEGPEAAEAIWLKGWLLLESKGDAQSAYLEFYKMYETVTYAVSRARAAYWAARAAEAMGDSESAKSWYITAMGFPTTFYGQRAADKLKQDIALTQTLEPKVSEDEINKFIDGEFGRVIKICIENDRKDLANKFIRHAIDSEINAKTSAIIAHAMKKIGERALSVKAAKRAVQHNLLLTKIGYPILEMPENLEIEPELALAIVRQESEFDRYATSPANAMGLMQLLPSTAKEVAEKLGMHISKDDLFDPKINILLGSSYISRLINAFDGSLPMAIAAYNAGPGRVKKWRGQFGDAGQDIDESVNWLEKIPYEETRNYVHRVMENYYVYKRVM